MCREDVHRVFRPERSASIEIYRRSLSSVKCCVKGMFRDLEKWWVVRWGEVWLVVSGEWWVPEPEPRTFHHIEAIEGLAATWESKYV